MRVSNVWRRSCEPDVPQAGSLGSPLEPLPDLRTVENSSELWMREHEVVVARESGALVVALEVTGERVGERNGTTGAT
jgi:hypothetical protein